MNHRITSNFYFLNTQMVVAKVLVSLFVLALMTTSCKAQTSGQKPDTPTPKSNAELQVSWLYGAYVPKDIPLHPLSNHQRFQLFVRQSFTTPGVYAKTAFFSLSDQAQDHPPEWGDGFGAYAKRTASRYGQFVAQNALTAFGNALLGYEPRYDRCRCDGFWPRTRHAIVRNFVTYNKTEQQLRPQFAMYAGAFAGGVIAATWLPANPGLLTKGYQGLTTQAIFGICANWLGEFAPDIKRVLKGNKAGNAAGANNSTPKND
jgi:hypothetical protein